VTRQPYAEPFDYQSEEVAEAFTEWCAARRVEARDDQEYRWLRQAFTAGMNEIARYMAAESPGAVWECPLCHSLFERPGFEHEPCRAALAPARLAAQLADALNRIRAVKDDLRGALAFIRVLDGLRPTCVICHDAAADRQTTQGPACTDCVGRPPDLPDPDDPKTWAFPDGPWDLPGLADPGPVTLSPWGHPEPPRGDDPDEPTNRDIEPDPGDWHDGPDPEAGS
jgi:hypothetical protein